MEKVSPPGDAFFLFSYLYLIDNPKVLVVLQKPLFK